MNVRLLFRSLPQTIGGGFTYVDDLFGALLKCACETSHHFFIFCGQTDVPKIDFPPNIHWIPIHRTFRERLFGRMRFEVSKQWHSLQKRPTSGLVSPMQAFTRKKVAENGVVLSLCWDPWAINDDLPYRMTVWDMAHRLIPYFPEFFSREEWDSRESLFGHYLVKAARIVVGTEVGRQQILRFYTVAPERVIVIPLAAPTFTASSRAHPIRRRPRSR